MKAWICLGTVTKTLRSCSPSFCKLHWFFNRKLLRRFFFAILYVDGALFEELEDVEKDGEEKQKADDGSEKVVEVELRLTLLIKP